MLEDITHLKGHPVGEVLEPSPNSYFRYNPQLSDRFRGTPAALVEIEFLIDKNCSYLENFALENGLEGQPLDCAADFYNMDFKQRLIYEQTVKINNGNASGVEAYLKPQFDAMRRYLNDFWNI